MSTTISTQGPIGSANPYNHQNQQGASVAALAGGGYVLTWQADAAQFGNAQIYSQRFDNSGVALEPPVAVGAGDTQKLLPSVIALAGGGYVAAWIAYDTTGPAARFQVFDAQGFAVGSPKTTPNRGFLGVAATALADGGFLVAAGPASGGSGLLLHRYDAAGAYVGAIVTTARTYGFAFPEDDVSIAGLADGGFVVTWSQPGTSSAGTSGDDVMLQRYAANGAPAGPLISLGASVTLDQNHPDAVALAGGGFVVAWASGPSLNSSSDAIRAQMFDAAGAKVGAEILVEGRPGYLHPAVAATADGGFVVTSTYGQAVSAIRFDSHGQALAAPVQVNLNNGEQTFFASDVAVLSNGAVVAAWVSQNSSSGAGSGVLYKVFGPLRSDNVLTSALENAVGDGANDVFLAAPGVLNSGDNIDGGGGADRIQLTQSGSFDFSGVQLTHVEEIRGTAGQDILTFSGPLSADLQLIDGGGGQDILRLAPGTDLSKLPQLNGNWLIQVTGGTGQNLAIADSFQAVPIDGSSGAVGIDGTGFAVTAEQRAVLFSQGLSGLTQPGDYQFVSATQAIAGSAAIPVGAAGPGYGAAAGALAGGYLVVWAAPTGPGANRAIFGQRFDESGAKIGAELKLSNLATYNVGEAVVTSLADGGSIVTWSALYQPGANNQSVDNLYIQRFDAQGARVGTDQLLVSATTIGPQSVTGLVGGGYVVAWGQGGSGLSFRVFDSHGMQSASGSISSGNITAPPGNPSVSALADGGFVLTWHEPDGQPGYKNDVHAQRYDAQGATVGAAFVVNTVTAGDQSSAVVASLLGGDYVVAWLSTELGYGHEVRAQRFTMAGVAIGAEWRVDAPDSKTKTNLLVTATADGGFLVGWDATTQYNGQFPTSAPPHSYAQRYDAAGAAVGFEFALSGAATAQDSSVAVAALPNGDIVAIYSAVFGQINPTYGLTQRIFQTVENLALSAAHDAVASARPTLISAAPSDLTAQDSIVLGSAVDRLELTSAGTLDLNAPARFSGVDLIVGSEGDDTILASSARFADVSMLFGGGGFDSLLFTGQSGVALTTRVTVGGIERIVTTALNDTVALKNASATEVPAVDLGAGDDLYLMDVRGGAFDLTLGPGADVIRWSGGYGPAVTTSPTIVKDFTPGVGGDRVEMLSFLATALASYGQNPNPFFTGHLRLQQNGADTLVQLGQGGGTSNFTTLLVLKNVDALDLSAANFEGFLPNALMAPTQVGGSGADAMVGGAGHDYLQSGAGNDTLTGGGGSDRLDGGAGFDTAVYAGAYRSYSVGFGASAVSGGPEGGTDSLIGVERLKFVDGYLATGTGDTAAQVYRLYQTTLGRAPDSQGLTLWTQQIERNGASLASVANGFIGSPEFNGAYGGLSNSAFVELMYQNVLHRASDAPGKQSWLTVLANGGSRADIVIGFSESQENIRNSAPGVQKGIWVGDLNAGVAARFYDTVFSRLPDAAGLDTWTKALNGGASLQTVANGFVASQEFQTTYGALNDDQFVELMYQNVLGRASDVAGKTTWLGVLNGGGTRADVVIGFSESPEHIRLLAPHIDDGVWVV